MTTFNTCSTIIFDAFCPAFRQPSATVCATMAGTGAKPDHALGKGAPCQRIPSRSSCRTAPRSSWAEAPSPPGRSRGCCPPGARHRRRARGHGRPPRARRRGPVRLARQGLRRRRPARRRHRVRGHRRRGRERAGVPRRVGGPSHGERGRPAGALHVLPPLGAASGQAVHRRVHRGREPAHGAPAAQGAGGAHPRGLRGLPRPAGRLAPARHRRPARRGGTPTASGSRPPTAASSASCRPPTKRPPSTCLEELLEGERTACATLL